MQSATVHNINNLVSCFALLGESNALSAAASAAAPLPLHYPLRSDCSAPPPYPSPTLCISFSLFLAVSLCLPLSVTLQHSESVAVCLWSNYCICCPFFASLPACLTAGVVLPPSADTPSVRPLHPSFSLPLHTQLLLHSLCSFGCQACLDIRRAVELALALAPTFSFQNSFTFCRCPSLCCSPTAPLCCYFYCRSSSTSLLVCVSIWRICFALLAFLFNVD